MTGGDYVEADYEAMEMLTKIRAPHGLGQDVGIQGPGAFLSRRHPEMHLSLTTVLTHIAFRFGPGRMGIALSKQPDRNEMPTRAQVRDTKKRFNAIYDNDGKQITDDIDKVVQEGENIEVSL